MSEYAPPPRSGPDTVPGPELGQPQGPPLAGLTVVDLSRVLAGPFATMLLGDLGAEVIKSRAPDMVCAKPTVLNV